MPDQPRHRQHQDAPDPRRGHRPLGHQGQPRGAQEHSPAQGDPERHGKTDEGRARTPRGHSARRGREALRHPHGRGRKGIGHPARRREKAGADP